MENITISTSQVYLSEENTDPDKYIAKFILCDFGRNKNGVALDRNTIENWMSTIIDNPLVGKIKMKYDGTADFSGHNVTLVKKVDEYGNEYQEAEFDTDAFGTFKDIAIEEIDGKEYLVASCVIWKRFTTACNIILKRIQTGTLFTSWEIATEKTRQGIVDGFMTKIIEAGRFIGHCILGRNVEPAFDSSHLLEIASTENTPDVEFAEALSHDILRELSINKNEEMEVDLLKKEMNLSSEEIKSEVENTDVKNTPAENEASETPSEDTPADISEEDEEKEDEEVEESKCKDDDEKEKSESETSSTETETSSLTEWDLRRKITDACRAKVDNWCWVSFFFPEEHTVWCEYEGAESELDYLKFTYTVFNDEVTVGEPEKVTLTVIPTKVNETVAEYEKQIAEKDELITTVSAELTSLKAEISELNVYKEKFEASETERIANEIAQQKEDLIASVCKSGMITKEEIAENTELSAMVEQLDKKGLMSIVGERLLSSIEQKPEVETSEVSTETVHVATNLNNDDEETLSANDKVKIMRKFLGK